MTYHHSVLTSPSGPLPFRRLGRPYFPAGDASSPSRWTQIGVDFIEWVSVLAMRFAKVHSRRGVAVGRPSVLSLGDALEVGDLHAGRIVAEMVDDQAFRNRPVDVGPNPPMRTPKFAAQLEVPVTVGALPGVFETSVGDTFGPPRDDVPDVVGAVRRGHTEGRFAEPRQGSDVRLPSMKVDEQFSGHRFIFMGGCPAARQIAGPDQAVFLPGEPLVNPGNVE